MRLAWGSTKRGMAHFWQGLREWCGDSAYEKYKQCAMREGQRVLSPAQFYVEQLDKKYSRPNRCC